MGRRCGRVRLDRDRDVGGVAGAGDARVGCRGPCSRPRPVARPVSRYRRSAVRHHRASARSRRTGRVDDHDRVRAAPPRATATSRHWARSSPSKAVPDTPRPGRVTTTSNCSSRSSNRRDLLLMDARGTGHVVPDRAAPSSSRTRATTTTNVQPLRRAARHRVRPVRHGAGGRRPGGGARRAGDRPGRPLRRLVRNVLRPVVRDPAPRPCANPDARRRLPGRGPGPVVSRPEPGVARGAAVGLRTRPGLRCARW